MSPLKLYFGGQTTVYHYVCTNYEGLYFLLFLHSEENTVLESETTKY